MHKYIIPIFFRCPPVFNLRVRAAIDESNSFLIKLYEFQSFERKKNKNYIIKLCKLQIINKKTNR